jgi:hypothetical protein
VDISQQEDRKRENVVANKKMIKRKLLVKKFLKEIIQEVGVNCTRIKWNKVEEEYQSESLKEL